MELATNARPAPVTAFMPAPTTWLKIAIVYLLVGITIGIGMAPRSALALFLLGTTRAVPFLAASEFVAAGGIIAFALNLFLNVKPEDLTQRRQGN